MNTNEHECVVLGECPVPAFAIEVTGVSYKAAHANRNRGWGKSPAEHEGMGCKPDLKPRMSADERGGRTWKEAG
jgi:hypothetical protein